MLKMEAYQNVATTDNSARSWYVESAGNVQPVLNTVNKSVDTA
jgi:hypothetical protein